MVIAQEIFKRITNDALQRTCIGSYIEKGREGERQTESQTDRQTESVRSEG